MTPSQVQFPGGQSAGRLETRVLRNGKWSEEVVYLLSSLRVDQLQAAGMLKLKRRYWTIESKLHHCLDVTMREDHSRVRNSNTARVLGTIRRVVVTLSNAAITKARKKNPKTKVNTSDFQHQYKRSDGGRERLRALIFAKKPNIFTL